jgi:hypothetical protein
MIPDCPRCDLHFERSPGTWTGALGINTIVSFGLLLLVLVGVFVTTYPDIPEGALVAAVVAEVAVVPIGFYPYSKTIWLAIDLGLTPLEPGEARIPPPEGVARA